MLEKALETTIKFVILPTFILAALFWAIFIWSLAIDATLYMAGYK